MRARCTSTTSKCASRPTSRRLPKPTCAARSRFARFSKRAFPPMASTARKPARATDAESLWLVDPIDGTKAFVREYPMFSTQIALMRGGEIVLGVSSAPVYGELAYAERGCGAYLNGKADRSEPGVGARVGGAVLGQHEDARDRAAVDALRPARSPRVNRIRGYGDFPALPFARGRQDRRGDRNRREHPRHRRVRRDRDRGRGALHRARRRADHACAQLGAGEQRTAARRGAAPARGDLGEAARFNRRAAASVFRAPWPGR